MATLTSLLCLVLAAAWMFTPSIPLSNWGVEFSSPVGLVARRGAALYAGIAVMFFMARNEGPSPVRSALVMGMLVTCATLAALGLFEVVVGNAKSGILTAVLVEVALAAGFWRVSRTGTTRH